MDVRDRDEAQQLERRRLSLALRRGSQHESLLREQHPERFVAGGLGIAFVVTVAAGITGLVAPRAPKGWDDPGRLVVAQDAGQRYAVDGTGVLRPVLNDTSLRLAYPSGVPQPVQVRDVLVRDARRGEPLGRTDVPFEPPLVLDAQAPRERCAVGDRTVVVAGVPAPGEAVPALVRVGDRTALLAGGRLSPVADPTVLPRLGWAAEQAVPVAPVVLEAVPPGPPLASLTVAANLDPAVPPLQREGTLVVGEPSGASSVVVGGLLRPLPTRTAVQLVFGPQPPPAVPLPDALLATAPRGEPVVADGLPEVPPTPAAVPPGGALCVDAAGGARALAALPGGAVVPEGPSALVTPRGSAELLATSTEAVERTSERAPLLLVAEGRSYPVPSVQVLNGLGYRREQVRLVSADYAGLAPAAPALVPLDLGLRPR